jgi:hypothetical protein
MIEIVKYESQYKSLWDDFVRSSKNGTFLFYRDYVEYHRDRFLDSSLLFFKDGDLVAVMPANTANSVMYSHGGLTFGGIISDEKMKIGLMLNLFDSLMAYLNQHRIIAFVYKPVPHIYHTVPAEEDLYALFRCNARLTCRDVSAAIALDEKLTFSKGKKRRIKLGKNSELTVRRTCDFGTYMSIVEDVLARKYETAPTHTASEIEFLATRFPENIRLFAAYKEGEMLAGVIIYENNTVAHAQYIASSEAGKTMGAGEFLWDHLINERYIGKKYFDFGISTEKGGSYLNAGLIAHKEGFGARAIAYDSYKIDVTMAKPAVLCSNNDP